MLLSLRTSLAIIQFAYMTELTWSHPRTLKPPAAAWSACRTEAPYI